MNSENLHSAKELISEAGLKATHPRMAVLSGLLGMDSHPTAEQVHGEIHNQNPSISLGSVYRILEKLVDVGLAYQVASKNGFKRYDARLDPHNHIYSVNTEEIQDYTDPDLNDLVREYLASKQIKNFKITDIKVQINGEKNDPNKRVTIF